MDYLEEPQRFLPLDYLAKRERDNNKQLLMLKKLIKILKY